MHRGLGFALIAFAITLALVIGTRLSEEALALLVGIVFGVAATLPVSLGLWIALTRHWDQNEIQVDDEPRVQFIPPPAPPPVIFMAPSMPALPSFASSPYAYTPNAYVSNTCREFRIVGEE